MPNLTSALEIGSSALRAQQIGLNVTGNNIANVNTPGYSRKTANLTTNPTVSEIGTGVQVASLTRARDTLLDGQYRFQNASVGELDALQQTMGTVETIFTELAGGGASQTSAVFDQQTGAGLSGSFSQFFTALQDLANDPSNETARAAVREQAVAMTDQFHRLQDKLSGLRDDTAKSFKDTVDQVNQITSQIAKLNAQIMASKKTPGSVVGDLQDQRDKLIDDLSNLIDVKASEQADGSVKVSTQGGTLLVDKSEATGLASREVVQNGSSVLNLAVASTGATVQVSGGKLKGFMEARDDKIVQFQKDLDTLASTFVSRVNAVHSAGFGLDGSSGVDFFDPSGTTARTISVSSAIMNNLDKIAASGPSAASASTSAGPGDGSNALALSDLRDENMLGNGTQTAEQFYSDLYGRVGTESQKASTDLESQQLALNQVDTRRQNVQGVSINEESTSLIMFQRAYQAAARVVTMVDDMMQSVINM